MPASHEYPAVRVDLTETGYAQQILDYANDHGLTVTAAVVELLRKAMAAR